MRQLRAGIEGVVQRFLAGRRATGVIALVVVAAIGIGSAAGFVELSEKLERGNPKVLAVDGAVHRWFVISSDGGARHFFAQVGHVTGPAVLPWAIGLVVVVLLLIHRWAEALYLAIVTAGCGVMIFAIEL